MPIVRDPGAGTGAIPRTDEYTTVDGGVLRNGACSSKDGRLIDRFEEIPMCCNFIVVSSALFVSSLSFVRSFSFLPSCREVVGTPPPLDIETGIKFEISFISYVYYSEAKYERRIFSLIMNDRSIVVGWFIDDSLLH